MNITNIRALAKIAPRMRSAESASASKCASAKRAPRASQSGFQPILKWAGGKTKLLPELLKRMPASYGTYYEPFCGGAALYFAVRPELAVLGDANAALMSTYMAVRDDVEAVLQELDQHRPILTEQHYNAVRAAWNASIDTPAERAATFIYLNKTSYNGLWRVNQRGEFNTPWGKHTVFVPDHAALRRASAVMAHAQLLSCDYRETVGAARKDDFVYVDPPYDGTFTTYTKNGFSDVHQAELAFCVRELVKRGCKVMLSNSDTPRIRALYAGFRIEKVGSRHAIGRRETAELIITAGYESER